MKQILLLLLLLAVTDLYGQIGRIMLPSNAPLVYNPAFAGAHDHHRIIQSNNFNLNPIGVTHMNGGYTTYYLSYDQLSDRLRGGWGVEVKHIADSIYNHQELNAMYSPKFNLRGGKWTLAPAVKVGLQRTDVNGYRIIGPTAVNVVEVEKYWVSSTFGVMLNTSNFYAGVGIENLISREVLDRSEIQLQLGLATVTNVQAGYVLNTESDAPWTLSFNTLGRFRTNNQHYQIGANFRRKWLLAGMNYYRSQIQGTNQSGGLNGLIPSLGVQRGKSRLTLSYHAMFGLNSSQLENHGLEISLRFLFDRRNADTSSSGASPGN